jgi:very-short-patch-repair endonuclease
MYKKVKNLKRRRWFSLCDTIDERINFIINTKQWELGYVFKEKVVSDEVVLCIGNIISTWDKVIHIRVKHLSTLVSYCDEPKHILKCYNEYYKLSPNERRARILETYKLYYGEKQGEIEFLLYNNTNKKSLRERMTLKYDNPDDKIEEWKYNLSKSSKLRVDREGTEKQRERSCFCHEFWVRNGYSIDESKNIISSIQSKNSMKWHKKRKTNPEYYNINVFSTKFWTDREYSVDGARYKVFDMYKRCIFDNKDFNKPSKQSLSFINFILDNTDMECGDVQYEYQIGIYSVDFYIPRYNMIIEFYGDYWHCNPLQYDPLYEHKILGTTAQDKWSYDKKRIDYITERGYNVSIIWENDFKSSPFEVLDKIKEIL